MWHHQSRKGSQVPNITLKGVPLKLYRELKLRAAVERRSRNGEVIRQLEESVARAADPAQDPEAIIRRVRERQAFNKSPLPTDAEITAAKRRGRR